MKILAIHSVWDDNDRMSAVDIWRVYRPMEQLKKHTDWQIDYQPTFIPHIEKYKDASEFTPEEMEKAAEHLGQYDIVFSSYLLSATEFVLMQVIRDRYGTQFVLDVDDDMFTINPDNPYWLKVTEETVYHSQCMIRANDWLVTTTRVLQNRFNDRREKKNTYVIENYISDDYKEYDPKNKDIVIGYFGGASHYADLNETGVIKAIEKIMHEDKTVRFHCAGMPVESYLPRGRYKFIEGKKGKAWHDELFPKLNFDITIAPLVDNLFNWGKSDIKWQEATRMGSAFVCSNIGPYKEHEGALTVPRNTEEDWYKALKRVIQNESYRMRLVKEAREALPTLENNWQDYKVMFEEIHNANSKTST